MIRIRPHKLFNLVQTPSYEARLVRIVLPEQKTPVLLDTAILLALAKLVHARTVFEFGTYVGIQPLNLAANLPETQIYTLDLDEAVENLQQDETLTHLEYQNKLAFLNTPYEKRITTLHGDSNEFDFSNLEKRMDVVYVDGGHDRVTLDSDTKNAFKIISQDHAACIAWHDYGNPRYPHLTEYLSKLSETRDLFYVEESWTTFFVHNADSLLDQLKS